MEKSVGRDLSVGDVRSILISTWIPLLIGTLLTMGYSLINAIWVGQIMGDKAMSGIAVTMPILQLVTALSSGVMTATSILISQFFGANEEGKMKSVVFNTGVIAVVLCLLVTGGGLLFCDVLLRAMGTPADVFDITSDYMKIIFISFIFTTLFSLISSILRGVGDTKKPMVYVLLSTAINAILDPLLIIGVGPIPKLGLNGAALASLLASVVVSLLAYLHMRKNFAELLRNLVYKIDFGMIKQILKIGIPTAIQQILFSISSIFVVTFVNAFGVPASAAFGAVTRIEQCFVTLPAIAMSMTLSIITGQNMGAGKTERVKEFFKSGVVITAVYSVAVSLLTILFAKPILSLFVNDPAAVEVGIGYFQTVGFAYILIAFTFVANGIINGSGKAFVTMLLSFVSICVLRIPLAGYLDGTELGIQGIWVALAVSYGVSTILYWVYYFLGKWKSGSIENGKEVARTGQMY
ncbi:MAG TPA: MATE family efflux transporter [Bacilli bacterium]|nr:MATE family efflux transporter [Bacilli bacterium]